MSQSVPSSSSVRSFSPPSPECPAANILIKIPLVSVEIRNDIRDRIEYKLHKISNLKCKFSRMCHSNIARRIQLSKAILEEQGALRELHGLASSLYMNRHCYKVGHAERYLDHSCNSRTATNTSPSDQVDLVDLVTDSSSPGTSEPEDSLSDPEIESIDHLSQVSYPSS